MNATPHLFVEIEPGSASWTVAAPALSRAPHVVANPLEDAQFLGEVRELRAWASRPIVAGDPLAAGTRDYLDRLSHKVGERITTLLLAEPAREALAAELRRAAGGQVRLTIRVREAGPPGDAALALPWELLAPEPGTFALRSRSLRLTREGVTEGAPDLPAPGASLAVAVMIAAPEDRTAIPYEEESFRLQLALSPLGHEVAFSNLGGLRELVQLVEDRAATVIHFSGHGLPGKLLFENELGFAEEVAVEEVQRQLHQVLLDPLRAGSFPRLFFLSSCHGAARGPAADDSPSTAAALHRRGFAQVLGYFGPRDAELSSRAEETFYRALARGSTALDAAEALRDTLDRPLGEGGGRVYPLAWSQLAVYHRGPDLPLARPGASSAEVAERSRRRMVQVSGLPVLERGFIGRRGLQHEVLRRIRGGQRLIVLQGLGGLGKTALASQLVSRVLAPGRPADQLILRCLELDAGEDPILALQAQAEEHGRVHGFPGWDERMKYLRQRVPEAAAGFAAVIREIRKERPGLVIYADNAESLQSGPTTEDARALGSWRPRAEAWWDQIQRLSEEGILVLASTRYGWEGLETRAHFGIGPMGSADTLRLIASFEQLEGLPLDIRKRLAQGVDGHPRTVEFLDRLVGFQKEAGGESEPTDVWAERIEPVLPRQEGLIRSDLLLEELWQRLSEGAREHAGRLSLLRAPAPLLVIDRLGRARDELIRSSFLTRYRQLVKSRAGVFWGERWSLHGLVKDFFLSSPGKGEEALHRLAGIAFEEALQADGVTWGDHAEAIHHLHSAREGDRAWPLVEDFVTWLRESARYREALEILAECEESGTGGERLILARMFGVQIRILRGDRHDDLMQTLDDALALAPEGSGRNFLLHEKGRLLFVQGNYTEAEQIFREILDALKASLGPEDPEYGAAMHSVALSLGRRGDYERAEDVLKRLIGLAERILGVENELFMTASHSLGGILESQGKYAEAEGLLQNLLPLRERVSGIGHPEYGASLRALALALAGQGKYEEAEGLLRQSVLTCRKALGSEHPSYGVTLHSLAWILGRQGKYSEAEEFLRQALAVSLQIRGFEHPEHGKSLHMLAWVLERQGSYEEAQSLLREARTSIGRGLGEEHPSYAAVLQTSGWVLERRGRYEEAEGFLRQALRIREGVSRREEPAYGMALQNLAVVLERQGKYEEGERVVRRALQVLERSLGPEHPDSGGALFTLSGILESLGGYGEAEGSLRKALAVLERALGAEHPTLAPILTDLAIVQTEQGQAEEAERLVQRALSLRLGAPERARTLNILAQVQFALKRPEAAETARQALLMLIETLGREHPVTQEAAPILLGILRRVQRGS